MNPSINKYKIELFGSKFNVDLFWNIGSFALSAIIGLLLNIIIIRYYDSAILGYFNQVYAVYIFLSQVATWGLHLAVQKFIPQYYNTNRIASQILTSAFFTTFIVSTFITIITLFLNKLPGYFFASKIVSDGFILAVPGLLFFSLNKVLLSYLNGIRQMVKFATFNFLRFAFMLTMLLIIILLNLQPKFLSLLFTVPELLLFILIFISTFKHFGCISISRFLLLSRLQFRFGSKAALGNIVLDLNSKVDVIILGFFLPDRSVGIYSFAAFIVDGLLQLFYVFRTIINPLITDTFYNKGKTELEKLAKINIAKFYKISVPIGIVSILLYPIFLQLFKISEFYWLNISIFSILTFGCIASSGYIPFQMIFNQTGKPGMQSVFLFLLFSANVALNLLLVPLLGIIGSAIATSFVFILQIFLLKILVMKKILIRI